MQLGEPRSLLQCCNCLSLRYLRHLLQQILCPNCLLSAPSALSAGEYSHKSTQSICTTNPNMSLADPADNRRQTPNNKTALTTPICLSLRNNAACCIRLRDLRYLRENNTQAYSIYPHNETPMSPADTADYRRRNNKPHNNYTIQKSKHLLAFSTQLCELNFNIAVILRKKVNNVADDECVNLCLFQLKSSYVDYKYCIDNQ